MFLATVRNTFRTLFRSWTFWLAVVIFAGMAVREGLTDYVTYAPGYEPKALAYATYVQGIDHRVSKLLLLALPFFVVVVTVLVLNRDYCDSFYEIEKAAGVKPSWYLLGRLCVVTAVSFFAQWMFGILCMGLFASRWGGVYDVTPVQFFRDCALRLLRLGSFAALPLILLCVGFTYMLGTICHNGFAATIGALALVIGNYAFTLLYQYRAFATYFDYFSPVPKKLFRYVVFYNVQEQELQRMGATFQSAVTCMSIFAGTTLICFFFSYVRVRSRVC